MNNTDSLLRIDTFATEWEAGVVAGLLQDEGIAARVTGGFTAGFRTEAPGYAGVMIDAADEREAREIIAAYNRSKSARLRGRVDESVESAPIAESSLRSRWFGITLLLMTSIGLAIQVTTFPHLLAVVGLGCLIFIPVFIVRRKMMTVEKTA